MALLSNTNTTLLDIARRLDPNGSIAMVAEVLQKYNEILDDIPWQEGNLPTGNQTTIRTSKPTPTFRLLNAGVVPAKSTTGQIVDTCAILETRSHVEKAVAELNGNVAAYRASEDVAFIEGMMDTLSTALIYGDVSKNPEQFNGLASRYFSISGGYTTSGNLIDGGGSGVDNTRILLGCLDSCKILCFFPKGSKAGLQQQDEGLLT